jgi:hypothetical protein
VPAVLSYRFVDTFSECEKASVQKENVSCRIACRPSCDGPLGSRDFNLENA